MITQPVSLAALLRLDPRDRAGLKWLKGWARSRITRLKVRRKHLPRGSYSPAEVEAFTAARRKDRWPADLTTGWSG